MNPATVSEHPARWRFSLRQLFGWVLAAAILLGIGRYLWLAIDDAREAARSSVVAGHAKQIVLAVHLFNDSHKRMPPAVATRATLSGRAEFDPGEPAFHSWRYLIFPFFESNRWVIDYSKPWDDPAYSRFKTYQQSLLCTDEPGNLHTKFLAVTGPDTAWGDGIEPPKLITDLPGDLIVFVETRNSGLHWMEPGDFDIRTIPRTINAPDGKGISGTTRGGVWVATADGSVHWVASGTRFEDLGNFFTIAGAEAGDIESVLPR